MRVLKGVRAWLVCISSTSISTHTLGWLSRGRNGIEVKSIISLVLMDLEKGNTLKYLYDLNTVRGLGHGLSYSSVAPLI